MPYQSIDEPISVYALFKNGKLQPLYFKWGQRVYKVAKITGMWPVPVGRYKLYHYGVYDSHKNFYQLCYSEEDRTWTISQVWIGG